MNHLTASTSVKGFVGFSQPLLPTIRVRFVDEERELNFRERESILLEDVDLEVPKSAGHSKFSLNESQRSSERASESFHFGVWG